MAVHSTVCRRSSRRWTRPGFSLVELLITMVVMGIVAALLLPLLMSARRMVMADNLRTTVNQSVRAGSDLVGADIRIAGERFPRGGTFQLPPIEIVDGGGSPDELLLRRNLWEGALPVCVSLAAGAAPATIRVVQDDAWLTTPPGDDHAECGQPIGTDGWPVNLRAVKDLADDIGVAGVLYGYLFNPAASVGEFVRFRVPVNANTTGLIELVSAPNLAHDYPLENRSRMYVLEERRYRVSNGILELVLNGDNANPLRIAADITGFRTRYVLDNGSLVTALPSGTTWREIRSMQVALATDVTHGRESVERELVSRFFPRNILSR